MSNEITNALDVNSDAVSYLPTVDQTREKWLALLRVLTAEIQLLRDVSYDLYLQSWIDNAEDSQLDSIGWIVGEARSGRLDADYRIRIKVRIVINRANGKVRDSLKVMRLVIEPTASVRYVPAYPAGYVIELENSALALDTLAQILRQVKPGGVRMQVHLITDTSTAFTLDDSVTPDGGDPALLGFGDTTDAAYGGILTEITS